MTSIEYPRKIREILDHLVQTQLPAVEKAADLVAESLAHGGVVYCSEIGHGIQGDFINRAGGMFAIKPFTFNFNVHAPEPGSRKPSPAASAHADRELESVRLAVKSANLRPGDVMVVASVSGRNSKPIELALACREKGLKVIGFTSLAYTAKIKSLHPSGKKLCDAVDVVIDNGAPYGDAAVDIAGFTAKLLPVSGVSMAVIGWMIWGRVMEKMAAAGNPPTVAISVNREGGQEHYDKNLALYNSKGF